MVSLSFSRPSPSTPSSLAQYWPASGGADIDPALYGQQPHPRTGAPRIDRDAWEDAILTAAIDAELPFLGICRGAQMLNVTLGGSLHQHLPDVIGSEKYQLGAAQFGRETVRTEADSVVASLIGPALDVPVYHHQSIDRLADGLLVTATTVDGVIEAVELEGVPFGVAVQWHPEEDRQDRRLFAGLVEAARVHRAATEQSRENRSTT